MNRCELVETLSTTLLWEVISTSVEELKQLPAMLRDIRYLENKDDVISKITTCEVFDSEPLSVIKFYVDGEKINIHFEMPFILSAWSNEQQHLRITSFVTGKCLIPDLEMCNWNAIDVREMNKQELLEYQSLVEILELKFIATECDDVSIV